jgi:hypothetical protein
MKNSKLNLAVVNSILRDNDIHYVGAFYEGSGDSGGIEEELYFGSDFKTNFEEGNIDLDYGEEGDIVFKHPFKDEILEYLKSLFLSHLDNVEDWWNNEGGYGTIMMDTQTGKYKNVNHCYVTEVEHFKHDGKFLIED